MSKSLNNFQMETFDSRAELEETLTKNISSQLKNSITETGGASLMVSGGSTPVILFKRLAQTKLAWQRVFVGLVDERWVPPNHQDSNEKLLRENLLQYEAKEALFLGLKTTAVTPEDGVYELRNSFKPPFTTVVLGMGNDGHTASWFPHTSQLPYLFTSTETLGVCHPRDAPHHRITLTLSAVLACKQIVIHITGDEKRAMLEKAMEEGSTEDIPIRAVLRQDKTPVTVYWAP